MKAYILTLFAREDRRENAYMLLDALENAGDTGGERITCELVPGVDCSVVGWESELSAEVGRSVYKGGERPLRPGEVCCTEGHLRIWRRIIEDGRPGIVLEDDIEIFDFEELALMCCEHLPTDPDKFDFAQLYHGTWNKPPVQVEWEGTRWSKVKCANWGTIGYVITPEGARKMVDLQDPIVAPADWYFKFCGPGFNVPDTAKGLRAFRINQPLLTQRRGFKTAVQKS